MSFELESIAKVCGQINLGGLKRIEYIPSDWIEEMEPCPNDNYTYTTAPVLLPGKNWLFAQVLKNTSKYSEDQKDNKQGCYWDQLLTAICPRDSEILTQLLNTMKHHCYVVKYCDRNGVEKVIGSKKYPLRFRSQLTTGGAKLDRNHNALTWYGQNPNKAPICGF